MERSSDRPSQDSARRPPSDDDEGEDLMDDDILRRDYQRNEVLDRYDDAMLDERGYAPLSADVRRRAEEEMEARDAARGVRPEGLDEEFLEGEEAEETYQQRQRRMKRMRRATGAEEAEEEEEGYAAFDLGTFNMPLREWLAQEPTRQEIRRRFRWFLDSYTDPRGNRVHIDKIEEMCADNGQSLEISYLHLSQAVPLLAVWVADMPNEMLKLMNEVARDKVRELFPRYESMVHDEIFARITHLPIADSLRELRHIHLNALIKVSGVVTRRTGVFPQLKVARFTCTKCGNVTEPMVVDQDGEVRLSSCGECQSRGPFVLNSEQTVYRNYQKITLQESPGSVPAGRVPRYKDVILLADLIDSARPGEEVEITGVYTHSYDAGLNTRQGFPVFATVLEANHVQKRQDALASYHLTEEDRQQIEELSRDPRIGERLMKSIAPSIYGNEHVKMGVTLSMFGGCEKNVRRKHRVRGDINVLLVGDPGTAKSQVLKYVETMAPRAVYTTGKGASAVGLTAAVHRDPLTKEWTLEGGALVLADRGICLIDEFDKMNDQDRTSIHEAMEQQSISISKAGIVTTLQARCAVMAAANPVGGRYDPSKTFAENVQLTDPILQRFDVLCVLQDTVDPVRDEELARFVVGSHMRSHPTARAEAERAAEVGLSQGSRRDGTASDDDGDDDTRNGGASESKGVDSGESPMMQAPDKDVIDQDLLRKYIVYARTHCRPVLTEINRGKVASLYAELRRESEVSNGVPIAVRHLESMMRLAEAHARMHLRQQVSDEDVNMAIRVMLESFIQAQKFSVMRALRRQFARYLEFQRDYNQLLLFKLNDLLKSKMQLRVLAERAEADQLDGTVEVTEAELRERARRHNIQDLGDFLQSEDFRHAGYRYDSRRRIISKTF